MSFIFIFRLKTAVYAYTKPCTKELTTVGQLYHQTTL